MSGARRPFHSAQQCGTALCQPAALRPAISVMNGPFDKVTYPRPGASNRQGPRQSRSSRSCLDRQVLRSPSAISAEPNLRPARRRDRPLDPGELGRRRLLVAGAPAGPPCSPCVWINQVVLPTTRRSRYSIPAAAATGRLWVYARDDRPWSGPEPPAAVLQSGSPMSLKRSLIEQQHRLILGQPPAR